MKDLKEYIRTQVIKEITAWKKHGVDFDPLSELKKYVNKGAYVFFGDVNKLGVNPSFAYTKPFGIWSYPLDDQTFDEIVSGNVRFAGDRKYIQVFRPKIQSAIMSVDDVTDEQYEEISKELFELSEKSVEEVDVKGSSPGERLLYLSKKLGGSPVRQSMLLRKLGIEGLIYKSRNIAVFFGKDAVDHLAAVLNPYREDRQP